MRVLIVDDHELLRKKIRGLVSSRDEWNICGEAADGIEAVEKAKNLRPDVVLMDVSMPRMDGLQAASILRQEVPESEVIIISQNDPEIVIKQAREVGAVEFISKSAMAEQLLRVLDRISQQHKAGAAKDNASNIVEQNTKNLLAAIVDSSDDAIISKNLNGVITSWNKGAERIFGYTSEEAVGQNIFLLIPQERRGEEGNILAQICRGERVDHFETLRRRKDGALLDVSLTISPVRDGYGRIVGASKIARDITSAKATEKLLRESEARFRTLADALDTQVQFRTRELMQRNAEIQRQAEQLQELSTQLLKSQDDERRRIARELHDSAGQLIAALGMGLAGLDRHAKLNPPLSQALEEAQDLVRQLNREIRTTSYLLHPPLLDESGLPQALQWYVEGLQERSGLQIELIISEEFGRLPGDLELTLFRIVQESLVNIHRHSESKTAKIRIVRSGEKVQAEIEDNGKGFSISQTEAGHGRAGVGIMGMRERVRHLSGQMDVRSGSSGTTVSVMLPLASVAGVPTPVMGAAD